MATTDDYFVIYEMKNGTEETFGPFNSEELKHERASAEREKHARDTHVRDYRVSKKPDRHK